MHKISRFAGATVRKPALPESEKLLSCVRTIFRQNKKTPGRFPAGIRRAFLLTGIYLRTMAGSRFPVACPISPLQDRDTRKSILFFPIRGKKKICEWERRSKHRVSSCLQNRQFFPAYRYARFDSAASRHGKSAVLKGTAPHFFEQSTPFSASCQQRKA